MPAPIWIVPAVLLAIALAPLPYGYYTFLRLVVCLSAGFIAFSIWRTGVRWAVAFVLAALLFNPLIPVFLDRGTWALIDLGVCGLYLAHWWFVARRA